MVVTSRIQAPVLAGEYRPIYIPSPDVYRGPDTPCFRQGEEYLQWIVNDFSFLKDDKGVWHAIGITHPQPPRFTSAFDFDETNIHEAESQLFHAVFEGSLRELMKGERMEEKEKLLYPQQRPGELPDCWAPAVFPWDSGYRMLYTPGSMRTAVSPDLYQWTPTGELFRSDNFGMRDPYVYVENGIYHLIYNDGEILWHRETTDFAQMSEPRLLQSHTFGRLSAMESPCLIKRDGLYYLLWCIHDGQNGCYDNRTYVFASETLDGFDGRAPLAMLKGHATELICEDGEWYIVSVHYTVNGLSIAPIRWEHVF